jgi:hypothetical protein
VEGAKGSPAVPVSGRREGKPSCTCEWKERREGFLSYVGEQLVASNDNLSELQVQPVTPALSWPRGKMSQNKTF